VTVNDNRIHYVSTFGTYDFPIAVTQAVYRHKRIDDFKGKYRDKSDGLWPNSDTVQYSFDATALKPVAPWEQHEAGSTQYCTPTGGQRPPCSESVVYNFPFVSDAEWQAFAEDSFRAFSTQIPTEVGVANFTWELRELGSLIPKLENSITQSVSGGYLNFQFGWKPFVGDLQKLGGILSTVSAKIKHLKDTYGKKTRLGNYRANVLEVMTGPLSTYNFSLSAPESSFLSYDWILVGYRCDMRAGGYLFHRLKDLDSFYGYTRALMVALGLDNPIKAVWNAIPYSFVSDWFTGLSRKLGDLNINPFKGQWEVSDFSSSAQAQATWRVVQVSTGNPSIVLGEVRAKRYERISRLPVRSDFITLNALSPQQLLLTNAMLAQQ